TLKGVAMIDPERLQLNTLPPPVQIESILYQAPSRKAGDGARPGAGGAGSILGHSRETEETGAEIHSRPRGFYGRAREIESRLEAPFPGELVLPAGTRRVEIHYTAPSLVAPEKVKFQVKLEGRDAAWQAVGTSRAMELNEP